MLDEARRILARARHRAVLECYEYWLRARDRSGRLLPGYEHLDATEMASFMPYVVLQDVVREGSYQRFRNKLIGTHVTEILGSDVTGMFIEQAGWLESFYELYQRLSNVTDEKVLAYGVSSSPANERQFVDYEHLTLPLAADGETVDMLLGVRCGLPDFDKAVTHGYSTAPLVEPSPNGQKLSFSPSAVLRADTR